MTETCVLCGADLAGSNRSWEHIIPESLGGKLRTDQVLCRSCNSRSGHDWDATLVQQLLPITLMVFPSEHSLGRKIRRIRDDHGNSLILKGGIRGGAEHPQAHVSKVGDSHELSISAPTKKRIAQEVERLVKKGVLPAQRKAEILSSVTREEALTWVEFEEARFFGGEATWRSMLKSMVTAGRMSGLVPQDMGSAVDLLRGSVCNVPNLPIGTSPVRFCGTSEFPVRRHCVHVETDTETHIVWGYLELYGTFTSIAQLGTHVTESTNEWTYCIDPVTGTDLTDDVSVDLTVPKQLMEEARRAPERIPKIWEEHAPNLQPLINECLHAHDAIGHVAVSQTSYGSSRPEGGARIREITWLSNKDSTTEDSS